MKSTSVSFFVPGKPTTKNKRRAVLIRGKPRVIPEKGAEAKIQAFKVVAIEHAPTKPIEAPVRLTFRFHVRPAKSWPKWKQAAALSGSLQPTSRPDLTRLVTFAEDCLTGLFFVDDAQVTEVMAQLVYGEVEGTEVAIVALPQAVNGGLRREEFAWEVEG